MPCGRRSLTTAQRSAPILSSTCGRVGGPARRTSSPPSQRRATTRCSRRPSTSTTSPTAPTGQSTTKLSLQTSRVEPRLRAPRLLRASRYAPHRAPHSWPPTLALRSSWPPNACTTLLMASKRLHDAPRGLQTIALRSSWPPNACTMLLMASKRLHYAPHGLAHGLGSHATHHRTPPTDELDRVSRVGAGMLLVRVH